MGPVENMASGGWFVPPTLLRRQDANGTCRTGVILDDNIWNPNSRYMYYMYDSSIIRFYLQSPLILYVASVGSDDEACNYPHYRRNKSRGPGNRPWHHIRCNRIVSNNHCDAFNNSTLLTADTLSLSFL
jgi:hypothetical protein